MTVTIVIFAITIALFGGYTIYAQWVGKRARKEIVDAAIALAANGQPSTDTVAQDEYDELVEIVKERENDVTKLALLTLISTLCTVISLFIF